MLWRAVGHRTGRFRRWSRWLFRCGFDPRGGRFCVVLRKTAMFVFAARSATTGLVASGWWIGGGSHQNECTATAIAIGDSVVRGTDRVDPLFRLSLRPVSGTVVSDWLLGSLMLQCVTGVIEWTLSRSQTAETTRSPRRRDRRRDLQCGVVVPRTGAGDACGRVDSARRPSAVSARPACPGRPCRA